MSDEIIQQVTEYVYKNYASYKGKQLFIKETDNCFHVSKHPDASPLILGKSILN